MAERLHPIYTPFLPCTVPAAPGLFNQGIQQGAARPSAASQFRKSQKRPAAYCCLATVQLGRACITSSHKPGSIGCEPALMDKTIRGRAAGNVRRALCLLPGRKAPPARAESSVGGRSSARPAVFIALCFRSYCRGHFRGHSSSPLTPPRRNGKESHARLPSHQHRARHVLCPAV